MLRPLPFSNYIKNVPTQNSVTEIGELVSGSLTWAEAVQCRQCVLKIVDLLCALQKLKDEMCSKWCGLGQRMIIIMIDIHTICYIGRHMKETKRYKHRISDHIPQLQIVVSIYFLWYLGNVQPCFGLISVFSCRPPDSTEATFTGRLIRVALLANIEIYIYIYIVS